ncbi:hypothetical protein [Streptomyces sp. NPDC048639]|uniref:hypothetical protein n=1 Tax=Streptomyces sp. NPDC048639 TaxID=3365581 RepID=UPI00371FFDCC
MHPGIPGTLAALLGVVGPAGSAGTSAMPSTGDRMVTVAGCTHATDTGAVTVRDGGDLEWVLSGIVRARCDSRPDGHLLQASLQHKTHGTWATLPPSEYDVTPTIHVEDPDGVSTGNGATYEVSAECAPGTYRVRYKATVTRGGTTQTTGTVTTAPVVIKHCDG